MPLLFVCPFCGSRKIGKDEGESEYYCDDCCEFFNEPKIAGSEQSEKEENKMKVDKGRLKGLFDAGISDSEIAKELGVTPSAIYRHRVKYKNPQDKQPRPKVAKQKEVSGYNPGKKIVPGSPQNISDVTALDLLRGEKEILQKRIIRIDQAIDLLS